MPLLDNEIARREGETVELRPLPLRVRWVMEDLVSSDGHAIACVFSCSVRALDQKAERKMLEETFLGARGMVTVHDVSDHFRPAIRAAGNATTGRYPASELVAETRKAELIDALRAAAERVAFSCGVEVLPPYELAVESPTYRRQRLDAMQRQLAEERRAGQAERFARAAELLKQFETVRKSVPGLAPGRVLAEMSAADQGEMLQTLMLASAGESASDALWAVAGPFLLRIDPRVSPPAVETIRLPATLGPLRSVQPATHDGRRVLLVGARSGVLLVDRESPQEAIAFADPDFTAVQGFNAAMLWNGEIWASHGEAGIVSWSIDSPDRPRLAMRPEDLAFEGTTPSPRDLRAVNDAQCVFSSGTRLVSVGRDGKVSPLPLEPRQEILAVLRSDARLLIVHADGEVCQRDASNLESICTERRTGAVSAAALLPWLGSTRLLLATAEGPVQCIGLEDGLVTQYLSAHRGLRMLAATADIVAGVSADRQRLVLWQSWDGTAPAAEIHITSIARHRVADVAFG